MLNAVVVCIVRAVGVLSLAAARIIGRAIGSLLWLTKGRSYKVTRKNIELCFPELTAEQQHVLIKQSLQETVITAFEACLIWQRPWSWLQTKIVRIEGEDLLRSELAQGKGLIVLAPHLGNWEVVAPYLASIAPLTAMYKPHKLCGLDKLIFNGRSKLDISMAPANKKGVCMLLKALQRGGIVGILPDQIPEEGAGAEAVNFFGHSAMTMSLVHALISRTQSRVVSVFAKRVCGGFHLITLPVDENIYSELSTTSLMGLNASIECCVRLAPAQYQWEYNRFRGLANRLSLRKCADNIKPC